MTISELILGLGRTFDPDDVIIDMMEVTECHSTA